MNKAMSGPIKNLDAHIQSDRIVQIASDLISCRSDPHYDMEYGIAAYLQKFLSDLGLDVQMQFVESKRYNVIARLAGKPGGKTLMYCGHIDVVPPGNEDNWTTPPFSAHLAEGKLYGRGSTDMKGGIASMLHVLELFVQHGVRPDGDILLVLVVDEETTNKGIKTFFKSGIAADACIVGEPTRMHVALGNKGVLGIWLTIKGKRVHAAIPEQGVNPIYHASSMIQIIEKYQKSVLNGRTYERMGNPTMTVTMIQAGKELNSVPPQCDMRIDRRLVMGETKENCLKEFEDLLEELKKEIPGCNCSYRVTTFCPPGTNPEDDPIVKMLCHSIDPEAPETVPIGMITGTTEASLILENMDIPVVICGPGDIGDAHIENEFVSVEELAKGSMVYARFFQGYFCGSGAADDAG